VLSINFPIPISSEDKINDKKPMTEPIKEPIKTSFSVCRDNIILDHPTKIARNMQTILAIKFKVIIKKAMKMVIET
jgi:hypothetical protein